MMKFKLNQKRIRLFKIVQIKIPQPQCQKNLIKIIYKDLLCRPKLKVQKKVQS